MNIVSVLREKAAWERGELLKRDETNLEEGRDDVLGPGGCGGRMQVAVLCSVTSSVNTAQM